MNSLYNLKQTGPTSFTLGKFDADLNVAAVYHLEAKGHGYLCDCPANQRSVVTKPCKHKRMLPFMLGATNSDRFYDPESRSWHQPLAQMGQGDNMDMSFKTEPALADAVGLKQDASLTKVTRVVVEPETIIDTVSLVEPPASSAAPTLRRR